jgi:predicted nucleotidyltransferase
MSDLESSLRAYFALQDGLVAVYLFGSTSRGDSRPTSDVDLGLLYANPPASTLEGLPLRLEAELERLLERPVQTVVLNTSPPDLIHRVLRDGKLVLDRDPSLRIRFEVQARNSYFDVLPFLRRYRRLGAA